MIGTDDVEAGDPEVVICLDEFGPLNLQPRPGRQGTTVLAAGCGLAAGGGPPTPPAWVRYLLAAYDLSRDRL
jgi:hypothetical protein